MTMTPAKWKAAIVNRNDGNLITREDLAQLIEHLPSGINQLSSAFGMTVKGTIASIEKKELRLNDEVFERFCKNYQPSID